MKTLREFRFVMEPEKQIGDGAFAYWTGDMSSNTTGELKYIRETAKFNYDSTKIYSEELLSIADQNVASIKENLVNDSNVTINKMKNYIAAVGLESDQIESLGWILTQQKNRHKRNLDELFSMILDWLESIEQSVDQTDADTKYIFELVKKLNTNVLLGELMLKTQDVMRNLRKINMKAHVISDNPDLKQLDETLSMDKWNNYMNEFRDNLKSDLKDTQNIRRSGLATVGFWILFIVGMAGLGGFVFLYMRLQRAIKNNHV